MKKRNGSSEIVTRGILREELGHLRTELDHLKTAIDDKAREYRDDILTKMDKTMGGLEDIREDSEIGKHQTEVLRADVDELKKKIKKLEKVN